MSEGGGGNKYYSKFGSYCLVLHEGAIFFIFFRACFAFLRPRLLFPLSPSCPVRPQLSKNMLFSCFGEMRIHPRPESFFNCFFAIFWKKKAKKHQ